MQISETNCEVSTFMFFNSFECVRMFDEGFLVKILFDIPKLEKKGLSIPNCVHQKCLFKDCHDERKGEKEKKWEDRLCIGICAAGKKSEKFLKHKITFVLSLQYLNSNGANFESALEVKNETEINLKKCAFDVGQNEEKNNQHKNEKYETNDTLRIEKVFHWK